MGRTGSTVCVEEMSTCLHYVTLLMSLGVGVLQLAGDICPRTQFRTNGVCTSCFPNRYVVNKDQTIETLACRCERGWETVNGVCVQCPVGKAGPIANVCTPCSSGRYTIAPGQIFCQECPPGLHCSATAGPTMYASLAEPIVCQNSSTRPLQLFESFSLHKKYAITKHNTK